MIELTPSPVNGYTCLTDPGEPGTNRPRLSINDEEARILQAVFRDRTVLEIGTGLGVSTRKIAAVASLVLTIDPDPWVASEIAPWLPPNVAAFTVLPPPDPHAFPLDAAFVDGSHAYPDVVRDIATVRARVRPFAPILFHDLYIPAVMQALLDSGLPFVHVQTTAGLALAWNDPTDLATFSLENVATSEETPDE